MPQGCSLRRTGEVLVAAKAALQKATIESLGAQWHVYLGPATSVGL